MGQRDPLHTGDQPRSILCFPLPLPLSSSSSFFLSHPATFFSPASAFYIKSHQRRSDEPGRCVSGLSVSLRGSLTVTRTRCSPVASFFSAFIFALRLFLKTHKLTLHICCILLLLFFPLSLPLFLLKLLAFIPCGNANAKTIKSSTRPSCLQYVWTAREKKLLIINSRTNQLSQCQSHCVREQSELFAEDQQLFRFCRLCTTEAGFHEERRYEISY